MSTYVAANKYKLGYGYSSYNGGIIYYILLYIYICIVRLCRIYTIIMSIKTY